MWVDRKFSDSSVFMKELVRRRGLALSYASAVLKDDREIVLGAVKQDGEALKYASAALQDDREIVLEAVKQNENGLAVAYASTALKDDREIVLKAVKQNGYALQYASAALKNNFQIVQEAVKQNGCSLQFGSITLRDDRKIVLEAVKQKSHYFASVTLKSDRKCADREAERACAGSVRLGCAAGRSRDCTGSRQAERKALKYASTRTAGRPRNYATGHQAGRVCAAIRGGAEARSRFMFMAQTEWTCAEVCLDRTAR